MSNGRWTYAPNGVVEKTNLPMPTRIEHGGRVLEGLTARRLPEFDYYPEVRDPIEAYCHGYEEQPVIEGSQAVYHLIIPDAETRKGMALDALAQRLEFERAQRSDAFISGGEPHPNQWDRMQMKALEVLDATNQRELTSEEEFFMGALRTIPPMVTALDDAAAAIAAWADDLPDWQAVHAVDPANLPQEAPQWP